MTGDPGATIALAARISAVEDCRVEVMRYLDPFGLSPRVINRVEVILEELVSNVVRHAAPASGRDLTLQVHALVRDEAVELSVEDDGPAFNPLDMAEPAPFTTLEAAPLGGLGIPLVRRMSRSVDYRRLETDMGGRNRLVVTLAL